MHREQHTYKITRYTHTKSYTSTTYTCTQNAHNMHTICTHTNRTQNNLNTEQHTENRTQDTTICSAHNYRTYSFDLYHEYAYIKNSNTIELYTISKENI